MNKYKVENLRDLVIMALETENDIRVHGINRKYLPIAEYDEWNKEYDLKAQAASIRWENLATVCDMLNVDQNAIIAVEKSIRRHMEKTRWEHFISVDTRIASESYRRAVSKK